MHKHSCECKHDNVKYCKTCRIVHCENCNQEWTAKGNHHWNSGYNQWLGQNVTTRTAGNERLTKSADVLCKHEG